MNRARLFIGPLLLGLGALALRWLPDSVFALVRCPIKAFTGLPCLTCGGTRALRALAHLDLVTAFTMNPLLTTLALGPVPYVLVSAWRRQTGGRPLRWPPTIVLVVSAGLLALLNWTYLLLVER